MTTMWTAGDEPIWGVDLLDKLLADKSILRTTESPGHCDHVPWNQHRPGASYPDAAKACRYAARDFCKDYLKGSVEGWTPYYRRPLPAQLLTKNLHFPADRVNRGTARIIGHLKNDKAGNMPSL